MSKSRLFKRLGSVAFACVTLVITLAAAPQKHMLFRVRGANGASVYLLGSVHLLTADAATLPPVVDSAFARAKTVVFETSIDTVQMRAQELVAKAQFHDGKTLASSLTPAKAAMVDSVLHLYGMSLAQVNTFKPWFVGLVMSQLVMTKAGFQPDLGVDVQLNQRAKAAGKTILGLESVDTQLNLLDALSPEDQEAMIVKDHGPAEAARELARIKDAWLAGDTARLDSLVKVQADASASMTDVMLTRRNAAWIPKIEELIRGRDDVLVVVGAAHLVGDKGVLALLRAKGYQIEQL